MLQSKKIFVFFLLAFFTAFIPQDTFSYPDKDLTNPVRIKVSVSSVEERLEVRLLSHLQKELESWEGVEIVYEHEDWEISVIASPGSNRVKDFSLSVLFIKPSEYRYLNTIVDHQLMVGYPNLQGACKRIVENFFAICLKKETKTRHKNQWRKKKIIRSKHY